MHHHPKLTNKKSNTKMSSNFLQQFFILPVLIFTFPGCVQATDFRCPEEFGYYQHPTDCSLYYVCVFGGPLLESCTGGLVYSHDLQTCDWPRNVACKNSNNKVDTSSPDINDINTDTINDGLGIVLESKKDVKAYNNRQPRKQSNDNSNSKISFVVKKTSAEQLVDEREEEDLLSLSPQPSIISTVTYGDAATKKNSIHSSKERDYKTKNDKESYGGVSSTEKPELRFSAPPVLNFGDVLYGSSRSSSKETGFGAKSSSKEKQSSSSSSDRSGKLLKPVNSSRLELDLIEGYPGVPKVLDDSLDSDPLESFYYVKWDDDIYDQFDDFGQVLSKTETATEAQTAEEVTKEILKNNIHVTYDRHHPKRPKIKSNGPKAEDIATTCSSEKCQLPDCMCGSTEMPGNLSATRTPQLVVLTFDDSVNDLNKRLYQDIFHPSRKNPNGCPIAATFYVSHEWTDYALVQSLYSDGHEIASHSISHSFGEQFSKKKWTKEMAGQREILAGFAGIKLEDVRGIRAPFLAIGGNNMFSMLYEANFTYDSSMPIYDNKPPTFPYTMDYKLSHDCMIPPCPNKAYPGVWELPLVMWNDLKEGRCSMADACSNPPTAEGVYYMIMKNFQRHYNTNRAPFLLSYHPAWFTTPHHKEGFELFLDTIVAMEDVWVVTAWQTIQWMRNPKTLEDIEKFKPFQCDYKDRPPRCDKPKVCNLWHKSGVRYMRTCQECPDIYPWTGRTGIANSLVDRL